MHTPLQNVSLFLTFLLLSCRKLQVLFVYYENMQNLRGCDSQIKTLKTLECVYVYVPMDSKLYEFNSNLSIDKR